MSKTYDILYSTVHIVFLNKIIVYELIAKLESVLGLKIKRSEFKNDCGLKGMASILRGTLYEESQKVRKTRRYISFKR